jgi:hypothetical protein
MSDFVTVDHTAGASTGGAPLTLMVSIPDIVPVDQPKNPMFFLPQSLSASLEFQVSKPIPPSKALDIAYGKSIHNAIWDIRRNALGDAWVLDYVKKGFAKLDGRGSLHFTPGWFSGGVFRAEYSHVKSRINPIPNPAPEPTGEERDLLPDEEEFSIHLICDDLGAEDGKWKLVDPDLTRNPKQLGSRVLAEELPAVPGEVPGAEKNELELLEQKEKIRFAWDLSGIEGFTEHEIQELIVALWVCKVWRCRNRKRWFI